MRRGWFNIVFVRYKRATRKNFKLPVLTKELTSGDQKESHLFKDVQRSLRNRDGLSKRLEPLDISMATSAKRDSSHPSSDSILDSSSSSPSNLGSLTHLVSPGGKGGKKDKASKGDKTPRIGGPGNIFSRLLSNGGKNKLPVFEDETEEILPGPLDEFGNPIKLTRRSSVICSSGRDKYTFDSETVELPLRSIDVYEKQYKKSLSSPTSPRIVSSSSSHSSSSEAPPRGLFQRTPSQLSSNTSNTTPVESSERSSMPRSEKSDEPSSALDEKSSNNNNNTSSSNRSSNGSQRVYQSYGSNSPSPSSSASTSVRFRRDSVVQSAKFGSQRSIMINGKFQNPWETWVPLRFSNILKFGLTKDKSNIPNKEQLDIVLPIVKPSFDNPVPDDGLRITWLGHSTVLLQMDGVTVITDPIFSERASPSQVIGPKRYRDPPCTVHDLPSNLDAVVISHNHYDHLDLNTVTLLNARYAADLRWFVPLGMRNWFEQLGCENVVELDWWEENCVPDKNQVSFVFTPAQHWSKRTLTDDNKSLWGSWTIIGPKRRFFFAGDTGYCPAFKEIGHTFGPFTVAAIPIGAFEPRWFMKSQHVNPEEAVAIHEDIKSKFTLGIHWGTFALANEYYLDPPMKLREALESRNISSDTFVTFKHGESRIVKDSGESVPEKPTRIKYQNRDKT